MFSYDGDLPNRGEFEISTPLCISTDAVCRQSVGNLLRGTRPDKASFHLWFAQCEVATSKA